VLWVEKTLHNGWAETFGEMTYQQGLKTLRGLIDDAHSARTERVWRTIYSFNSTNYLSKVPIY
jgi:hypothetical protein